MTARRSFTGSKVKVTETFYCEDIHVPINVSPHGVDFYHVSRSKMPSPKADVIWHYRTEEVNSPVLRLFY